MKILFFSDFLSDFFSKTIRNIREGDDFEFFFPISWDWSAKIYSLQVEPKNWIRQKNINHSAILHALSQSFFCKST